MASLGFGTHSRLLNEENIDNYVEEKRIGNYALGYVKEGSFYPKYVGRSDIDLNKRLHKHVGSKYKRFKFMYQKTARIAFFKECHNYHDFMNCLDNEIHPDRPKGYNKENLPCPVKNCDN